MPSIELVPLTLTLTGHRAGWLSSLSWLVGTSSALFLVGDLIPTLIALQNPSFVPQAWHGYLFSVAICLVCFVVNGFLAKHLPLLEAFVFCLTIAAFAVITIVLREYCWFIATGCSC